MLTADELLAVPPRRVVAVVLPIRGGEVGVRALTAGEAIAASEALKARADDAAGLAIQLAWYLSDAAGAQLLTVEGARAFIQASDQQDVRALLEAGLKLNRADDEGLEDARKN